METKDLVNTVQEKLEGWANTFIEHLPNLVLAIVSLVLAFAVSKLVQKYSKQLMKKTGVSRTIRRFVSRLLMLGIILLGFLFNRIL